MRRNSPKERPKAIRLNDLIINSKGTRPKNSVPGYITLPAHLSSRGVAKLDLPECRVDKPLPGDVVLRTKNKRRERVPPRFLRFAQQHHAGFLRQAIALPRVTRHTRANNILPGRLPSPVPR